MRKLFSLFVALLATSALLGAADFQLGDLYYKITNDTLVPYTVEVTYESIRTANYPDLISVTIPRSVINKGKTYSVTSIGEYAFRSCPSLESITIPNSVTSIGEYAFQSCKSLTSITIPNNVTSIGGRTFSGCSSLTSISIPNSVISIGERAFTNCYSLATVTLNSDAVVSKNYIPDSTICTIFGSQVKEYVIGNSVTAIGEEAFSYCDSLTSVTIGNSVTRIGKNAFRGCKLLTSVNIPNSVTSIGEWTFAFCDSLTSITLGNNITSIGDHAFSSCKSLISINIPNSVTSLGEYTFYFCDSLRSVILGNSVMGIERGTFWGCKSLNSITLPNSVTSIGDWSFAFCYSLASVTLGNNVTSIGESAFALCSSLTSINIPNSVTSIGKYAFDVCSSLTSITIGDGVTNIGDSAFVKCNSLDTIYCYAAIPPMVENTFINNDETNNYEAKLYVLCESLETYKAHAVWGQFANIKCIPEKEKTQSYIYYTSSDGNIVEPNAYLSATDVFGANIISNTYENGRGIITFDAPITSIGTDAFANCHTLTSITLPNSVTSIGDWAFVFCDSLSSITLPNSVTSIGEYAFYSCPSLESIALPNSVTSIGFHAFLGCYNLTSITIPNSVTSIGDEAFDGCSSLTSITIPNSVTSIGWNAFYQCYFADENFVNNSNCSSENVWGAIIVDDDVNGTLIKDNVVVYGRPNIDTSIIPEGVLSIKNGAFMGHERLTSVTIPSSVISIGLNAFYDCMLLKSIYCYALVPPIVEDWTLNYDATLYIPCEALEAYKAHEVWGRFNTIQCLEDSIPDPTERVFSCAEAVTVCLETGATATTEEYTIHGYVTEITTEYSEQYKNISFYMADTKDGGQVLFTYRIKPMYEADIAVKVGDFVEVVGKLVNYNGYLPEVYPGVYTIVNEPELPTGTSDIQLPTSNTKKVVKDGQLLILHDDKTYTIMGQEL